MRPTTALTLVALVAIPVLARPSPYYVSGGPTTLSRRTNNEISGYERTDISVGELDFLTLVADSTPVIKRTVQAPEPVPGASSDATPPASDPQSASPAPSTQPPAPASASAPTPPAPGASPPSSQDPVSLPVDNASPTKSTSPVASDNQTGGGKASKLEVTMVQWVRDRLFEVFFGLHLGKVRSFRAFTEPFDIDSVAPTGTHK
jgi:hypothetical protein